MNEDPNMRLNHILEAQQFNKKMLKEVFTLADQMATFAQGGGSDLLRNRILASLFFVPSNRTRFSFESAMIRLGGQVLGSDRAEAFSSELDGGSLEDTITTLNYFADVIVLRHHLSGSAKRAARVSTVPIINAGDGTAQHPTQALLDLARKVDVFYVTQIPVGSFGDRLDDYEASKRQFVIDRRVLKSMKKNSIIMHPLPRGPEIPPEMDKDLRAVYFQQTRYGLCIRMALLCTVFQRFP